jgi:acyl-CoA dehydrogenase
VIPVEDRIGDEGKGFQYILHGLNPERILIAAEAIGLGRAALARASQYAKDREVFDRPIGMNQSIQHPLAKSWMELEAAELMTYKAAALYDAQEPCAAQANSAKYLAGEACYRACENAILTHGGMGFAKEYHVERYMREAWIPRLAPVSPQLILCFIAEKVLGLPKSY